MRSGTSRELRRWRQTRLPLGLFLSLAAALVALAAPDRRDLSYLLLLLALAFLLLAQFRLLDDLFDRDYDRPRHPERVLVGAVSLAPFFAALAFLEAVNLGAAFAAFSLRGAFALAAATVAMLLLYAFSKQAGLPRLGHAHLVLLKYPFFVYLLAGAPAALDFSLVRRIGSAWLLAAIYELQHDHELRARPGARWLLAAEILLLGCWWIWPLLRPLEASP